VEAHLPDHELIEVELLIWIERHSTQDNHPAQNISRSPPLFVVGSYQFLPPGDLYVLPGLLFNTSTN
jgi:hypothetical protein